MEQKISREVTAERVRRVAEGYTNAKGEAVPALGGGFRYCQLGERIFAADGSINPPIRSCASGQACLFHRNRRAAALVLNRHRLVAAIEAKIRRHREQERIAAWQKFLLDESSLVAPEAHALDFSTIHYDPSWHYDGAFRFGKHYFAPGRGELKSSREEYQCACFLDGLAEVKAWVRNLSRRPTAFSLQISRQRFYPDFPPARWPRAGRGV